MHDTVTFASDFEERFAAFRLPASPMLFTTWPLPNSNVVAFGSHLLNRIGSNFDGNITKTDAFPCEFGYPLLREGRKPVLPLTHFGIVVKMGPRLVNGSTDIYGTGFRRIRFWYPAFGVYKYSLRSDAAGDILHGATTALHHGGRRWFPPAGAVLETVRLGGRPFCWERFCKERLVTLPGSPHPLSLPWCRDGDDRRG